MQIQSIVGPIMKRHGAQCSPEEFYGAVNLTFHEFESESYDELHAFMWDSLPAQFALLIEDCLRLDPHAPREIRMLDIGCGTGLAPHCILKTAIRDRIQSIDLLDVSPKMLERAQRRASGWGVPVTCHLGLLDSLPAARQFDLITTCSVLHHVPDLPAFLRDVRQRQADGGLFLHLQDPNTDFLQDPELQRRIASVSRPTLPAWARRFTPHRILGRVYRELTRTQGQDYLSKTNRALLEKGLITTPLSVQEIFSITDIRVHHEEGVSLCRMKDAMPDYECLSQRAYAFFGPEPVRLSPKNAQIAEGLMRRHALNGVEFGAVWKLRSAAHA